MTDQPAAQFGSPDCTCIPWTRQDGEPRYLGPGDTVDMISGWERGSDCPHHAPRDAALDQPARLGPIDYARQQEAERETAAVRGWAPHMDSYAKNFGAPAPATSLREQYAEVLWPLTDWDGDVLNAEAAADAILAVRDRELEQLRAEVQRLTDLHEAHLRVEARLAREAHTAGQAEPPKRRPRKA